MGDSQNKSNLSVRLGKATPLQIYNLYRSELYAYIKKHGIDVSKISTDKRKVPSYFWNTSKKHFCNNKKDKKDFETAFANVSNKKLIKDARKDTKSKSRLAIFRRYVKNVFSSTYSELVVSVKVKQKTKEQQTESEKTETINEAEEGSLERIAQQLHDKYNNSGYWDAEYFAREFYNNELDSEYGLYCVTYNMEELLYLTPVSIEKCDVINHDELINNLVLIGREREKEGISSRTTLGIVVSHKYKYIIVYIDEPDEFGIIGDCPLDIKDFYPEIFKTRDLTEIKKKLAESVRKYKLKKLKERLQQSVTAYKKRKEAEKKRRQRDEIKNMLDEIDDMKKKYQKLQRDFLKLQKENEKLKNKNKRKK